MIEFVLDSTKSVAEDIWGFARFSTHAILEVKKQVSGFHMRVANIPSVVDGSLDFSV